MQSNKPLKIQLHKKASMFDENFVPEVKNFPESLEIERQRTDDLEFEFFISDINFDDGITVS